MAMYRPNPYVEPTNNTMMELGIRYSVLSNLQLDLALFSQKLENINDFAIVKQSPLTLTQTTLPLEVEQLGVTISANYVPTSKIQLRPFITMQKSQLRNFDYYLTHPLAYNGQDEDLDSTPTIFGGFSANYTVNEKVNINLMGYYLGKQTLYNQENYVPGVGIMPTDLQQLNGKLLLNPKVSYRLHDKFKLEGTIRNLLGDESREHYATDRTARQYLLGINYNF
jgi:iron complex outermembrane receptor protein